MKNRKPQLKLLSNGNSHPVLSDDSIIHGHKDIVVDVVFESSPDFGNWFLADFVADIEAILSGEYLDKDYVCSSWISSIAFKEPKVAIDRIKDIASNCYLSNQRNFYIKVLEILHSLKDPTPQQITLIDLVKMYLSQIVIGSNGYVNGRGLMDDTLVSSEIRMNPSVEIFKLKQNSKVRLRDELQVKDFIAWAHILYLPGFLEFEKSYTKKHYIRDLAEWHGLEVSLQSDVNMNKAKEAGTFHNILKDIIELIKRYKRDFDESEEEKLRRKREAPKRVDDYSPKINLENLDLS
jgi:hypothetical protein